MILRQERLSWEQTCHYFGPMQHNVTVGDRVYGISVEQVSATEWSAAGGIYGGPWIVRRSATEAGAVKAWADAAGGSTKVSGAIKR